MNKQQLYALHSLAGINLSILICFILITGTLAVVSHEIDWLTNPSKRVLPAIDSSKINWSLIYQAVNKQSPNDLISSINAPIDDWFAVEVIRIDKNEQRYFQFYHPVTAKYKGSGRWYNWQRLFRMLHRHLMMPTIVGVTIVGMVGLLMFFSLISGFFLIPQWWNKFFVKPRTNNRKVFWNDCHRLFGLWSSWLLLILCITGTWYLLELWGLNAKFPEQKESITKKWIPLVGHISLVFK
ncbi:MAG: PepSY domain-containing protein [Gammaproteobacteria bacterium]|nr:PepSY domain-containing protein [Gammaproteobacteria bacterium]